MKRILLAVILASTFVGSMPAMEFLKNELQSITEVSKKTNFLIPSLIGSYALAYSQIYAHELGHALSAKILLSASTKKIHVSPLLYDAYTNYTFSTDNLSPESIKKRKTIISFAGPLLGLAANVLALKFHDILIECSRNNSNTLLQTCLKGLQKPLFNNNQSLWIQIPILWVMYGNIASLLCFGEDYADISHALRHLDINNPVNSYPKISKFISNSILYFFLPCGALLILSAVSPYNTKIKIGLGRLS